MKVLVIGIGSPKHGDKPLYGELLEYIWDELETEETHLPEENIHHLMNVSPKLHNYSLKMLELALKGKEPVLYIDETLELMHEAIDLSVLYSHFVFNLENRIEVIENPMKFAGATRPMGSDINSVAGFVEEHEPTTPKEE